MLSFVEEITLLLLDDAKGGFVDMPVAAFSTVIAGAALMDLAMRDRIDTDLEKLIVVDRNPTGDAILDDALGQIARLGGDLVVMEAIDQIGLYANRYAADALQRLIALGILREENGRHLWVFRTRRYPVIDDREEQEVKARLRQLLFSNDIPDPRDVVLICLIDACQLFRLMLSPDEIEQTAPRVEQLRKLDLIGRAVAKAVADIQFIFKLATSAV
jgi:golgi phosphoprotein 3